MDYPQGSPAQGQRITAYSGESLGWITSGFASVLWPATDEAIFVPFSIGVDVVVDRLGWVNGSASSGKLDCGIYDAGGNRLVSTGETTQGTISVMQDVNVTNTLLVAGLYFFAMEFDNGVGAILALTKTGGGTLATAGHARGLGMFVMAAARPLPATATFAACTRTVLPYIFLTGQTVS